MGVLGAGQTASGDDLADALDTLRSIYSRLISEGGLGRLTDVIADDGTFLASEMTRVFVSSVGTDVVALPETVTEDGAVRPIRDGSVIVVVNQLTGSTASYVFQADVGNWISIETLDATSRAPFADRDANGLAAYLAVELADEYGLPLGEATALAASRFHSNLLNGFGTAAVMVARPENYF